MKEITMEEYVGLIQTDEDYERLYSFSNYDNYFMLESFIDIAGEQQLPRLNECAQHINPDLVTTISETVDYLGFTNGNMYTIEYEPDVAYSKVIEDFIHPPMPDEVVYVVCEDGELSQLIKRYADTAYIYVYVTKEM